MAKEKQSTGRQDNENQPTYEELLARYEKRKDYLREYLAKPEVQERRKEYLQEYLKKPEVKERRSQYLKEYLERPDVKERRQIYSKKYMDEIREAREFLRKQKEAKSKK